MLAKALLSSFRKESREFVERRDDHNILAMKGYDTLKNRITKGKVRKWLEENDECFQRRCGRSDEYAVIDELSELTIGFKFVSIAGQGFVVLKDPERFPSIFSPVLKQIVSYSS